MNPDRECFHGVRGGCPYCRSIQPADDGPDHSHTDPADQIEES